MPIITNTQTPCPRSILDSLEEVLVTYKDFSGTKKTSVIEVHASLATDVRDFFKHALSLGFPFTDVVRASDTPYHFDDLLLMQANASSGFNYRLIAGTHTPSLHGLGRAIDINPRLNPYTSYVNSVVANIRPHNSTYDPSVNGTLTAQHPLVVFMKSRGWEWGGDWTKESGRIDLHHFQKPA